ncbi:MAG: hypothetical protein K2I79_04985, partial [Clostridia bacterium]|nr:hypothetical protein [Clostridia bacterium]
MLNLAVIYGGESCERDISVITAVQIMGMIDRRKYNVLPIMLLDNNKMVMPDSADRISSYIGGKNSGREVYIRGNKLMNAGGIRRTVAYIDCALLCVHGGMGEGGSLQGMLDMNGIPYTSPSVEASAVCMNKAISKGIFSALGASVLPCVLLDKSNKSDYNSCADKLGFPLIVKPARQGSSIGINVAKNTEELKDAVDTAFEYDSEVIVEKALTDYKEINCACVYSCGEVLASTLERPLSWHDFLTFEDKYMSDGKIIAGDREFPAVLAPQTAAAIRDCAVKLYKGLD